MSAKATTKAATKKPAAKPKGRSRPSGTVQPANPTSNPTLNVKHFEKVQESITGLENTPLFADMLTAKPLTMQEGGRQAPFNNKDYQTVIKNEAGGYKFGGSLFMQNLMWVANHKVPIQTSRVRQMQKFYLPPLDPPKAFPFEVTMAVDSTNFDITNHGGALERISPEEPCHAAVFSAHEALRAKAGDDIMRRWRKLFLTIPCCVVVVAPGDARQWAAINLREQFTENYTILARTITQRIYEVVGFKVDKEKELGPISSAKTSEFWKDNVKFSKGTEKCSTAFVDSAITVHNRVLVHKECRDVLEWAESNCLPGDNPFKSIWVLQAICDRCGDNVDKTKNAMTDLLDGFRMEYLTLGHFAVQKLKDYRESYVEVSHMKYDMKAEFFNNWLPRLRLQPASLQKITDVFSTVDKVRALWTPYPNEKSNDTTFLMTLPKSTGLIMDFVEAMIYGNEFNPRYKDTIKARGNIHDVLEYASVKAKITEIEDAVRSEQTPVTTTGGDGGGGGGAGGAGAAGSATGSTEGVPVLPTEENNKDPWDALPLEEKGHWTRFIWKSIRTNCVFISQDLQLQMLQGVWGVNAIL